MSCVSVRSADAGAVAYVLTTGGGTPAYAVILMPGGNGILDPRMNNNGQLTMRAGGNFLIRSRALFAAGPFVAASTDATTSPERILAIAGDLQKRFGPLKVYVVGTSRSTEIDHGAGGAARRQGGRLRALLLDERDLGLRHAPLQEPAPDRAA